VAPQLRQFADVEDHHVGARLASTGSSLRLATVKPASTTTASASETAWLARRNDEKGRGVLALDPGKGPSTGLLLPSALCRDQDLRSSGTQNCRTR
jgi:hypothetical protein